MGLSVIEANGRVGAGVAAVAETPVAPLIVPVDLSSKTEEVLRHASRLAERFGCVAEVLHVVQLNIAGEERGIPRTALLHGLAEEAQLKLWRLVDLCWKSDMGATVSVRKGRPHEVIVQEAIETGAWVIVMGGTQRRFFRVPGTSTCARVMRAAPCPVLTVGKCEDEGLFWSRALRRAELRGPRTRFSFV
jgi:nucleotide-binding universal stress UspA family protein